jgi:predicted transcriptional regulator
MSIPIEAEQIIENQDPAQVMVALDLYQLIDQYHALRTRKDELKKQLESVTAEVETANDELVTKMVESETKSVSKGGYTYSLNPRSFARAKDGCKEKLFAWLKRHSYGDIITKTVNANTLSSLFKEIKEAKDIKLLKSAQKVIDVYEKVTVGIRKGKA